MIRRACIRTMIKTFHDMVTFTRQAIRSRAIIQRSRRKIQHNIYQSSLRKWIVYTRRKSHQRNCMLTQRNRMLTDVANIYRKSHQQKIQRAMYKLKKNADEENIVFLMNQISQQKKREQY